MKTPRELLLAKYRHHEHRLDEISASLAQRRAEAGTENEKQTQRLGRWGFYRSGSPSTTPWWGAYWRIVGFTWVIILALQIGAIAIPLKSKGDSQQESATMLSPEVKEMLRDQWALREELLDAPQMAGQEKQPPEKTRKQGALSIRPPRRWCVA